MSGLWTPEQREWLQALGHAVFSLAGPADQAQAVETPRVAEAALPMKPPADEPTIETPRSSSRPPASPHRAAPPLASAESGSSHPSPPVPGRMGDPLYRALLRATARRTPREGESVLQSLQAFGPGASDPDAFFDALRSDPARKRALWLQLRAARKAGRQ